MKEVFRELLKEAYLAIPIRYRPRIFALAFGLPFFRRLLKPLVSPGFYKRNAAGQMRLDNQLFQSSGGPVGVGPINEIKAYRIIGEKTKNSNKVGVIIHAYHMDLLPSLLQKLENIPVYFNLYITAPGEHIEKIQNLTSSSRFPVSVNEVENVGYDLLPFIKTIPQLLSDDIDIVCKIHTKRGGANLEHFYSGIGEVWSKLLLNPILSSEKTVADILSAFESDPDLAFLGSASLYKSAEDLMYGNQSYVDQILATLGSINRPITNWGFIAGTMFWCRVDTIKPLLQLLKDKDQQGVNSTGETASYWHALERALGLLPSLAHKKVGLSFAIDAENTNHVISILDHEQQKLFQNRFGVGHTLAAELSIKEDLECLQSAFGNAETCTSTAACLGIDSILYYLRYGVFLGQELINSFNSHAYWHANKDVFDKRLNPLVHYELSGLADNRPAFPATENVDAACSLIEGTKIFDRNFYLSENPEVAISEMDPLRHFCEFGWLELRDPCPGFDIWAYWQEELDPRQAIINPAVFKLVLEGDTQHKSVRQKIRLSSGHQFGEEQEIRRICLFAGYDPEDTIDQTVLDYIAEINRFADVYYLSDGDMAASELSKLNGIVKGAWSLRHHEYDFGSYARLALNLIGWELIETYDELIFANDSCYLINSFDPVFKKMQHAKCDWWGLQATKGIKKTRWKKSNRFKKNIPMEEVKASMLEEFEKEEFYDFHVGSYFLVFRQPVIAGNELKELLKSVRPEMNKLNIIRKYEIGLTRMLIRAGYNFDTFMNDLFTFHPIYMDNHFELIRQGFPLFKRFFLTENHYHVPELWRWEKRLLALIPGLDLAPIKANLLRVSSPEKLFRNLHIRSGLGKRFLYPRLLPNWLFAWRDGKIKKNGNWWVFPVCAYDHNLTGNDRAVFEFVKNDPSLKKIVLVRDKYFESSGQNVEIVPLNSFKGQYFLLRSKVVFIKHTLSENVGFPLNTKLRYLINLWHGIPLKRIGYTSNDLQSHLESLARVHSQYHAVICSSETDRMAMACAFYPLTYTDIWLTGLPRIDFILQNSGLLPADMSHELHLLDEAIAGKRLILFCPTFRNDQEKGYYQFSREERNQLRQLLLEHNIVLGVREHMARTSEGYLVSLADLPVLDLGNRKFKNVEMIYRKADLLITDYSSCFMDFMVTGKPVISFAYDYDNYINNERGLFYDLQFAVPGAVCRTFADLILALKALIQHGFDGLLPEQYVIKRQVFHKYMDGRNTERVVESVRRLSTQCGTGL